LSETEKKKGFFGRLFGKKDASAEEAAVGAVEELQSKVHEEIPALVPEATEAAEVPEVLEVLAASEVAEGEGQPSGEEAGAAAPAGFFGRLKQGLAKTRQGFVQKIDRILFGKKAIDADTLVELEEALVTADLGVQTSMRLIGEIQGRVDRKELTSPESLRAHLRDAIQQILVEDEGHFELGDQRPYVLMVVGVNGVGKTTTIGKIAAQYRERGRKVILAAGDTFRAAAVEQLEVWGGRVGAEVVRHQHGSDPAAVAFDAVEAAKARNADLVIVDTAGRLHTKSNLMEELKKVKRVIGKALPGAPHEVLLVLDATTGQNAITQAKVFHEAVGVDSIALTKLDGTAKGGVIVGICDELKIPVQFIGIGEKVDDLRPFDARAFVEALF
jgi:fused signal recognition particle receptor